MPECLNPRCADLARGTASHRSHFPHCRAEDALKGTIDEIFTPQSILQKPEPHVLRNRTAKRDGRLLVKYVRRGHTWRQAMRPARSAGPRGAVIDTGDRQVEIRDMGEGTLAPQDVA